MQSHATGTHNCKSATHHHTIQSTILMPSQLSAGICYKLHSRTGDETVEHTVQFLTIKRIPTGNSTVRYRIIVSDGEHYLCSMLATHLNNLVYENLIGKNTVAVIEKMNCVFVQSKM